jgi:hypothetical protein
MSYSTWKPRRVKISQLMLDPENARFPRNIREQREIAAELLEHEDVLEIAESIAKHGYYPTEILIAVKDSSSSHRFIVIEGNRRLTACKCLVTPTFASDAHVPRFTALQPKVDLKALHYVIVVVAPSKAAAWPIIVSRHTASQIKSWKPAMQAKFYANLIKDGLTVEQLAADLGVSPGEIKKGLRTHYMYGLACSLPLPSDVALIVQDPRKFSISALERLFERTAFREYIGLELLDNGDYQGHIDPAEFKRTMAHIVTEIAKGSLDTRVANNDAQFKQYIAKLPPAVRPDRSKKGKFKMSELAGLKSAIAAKPKKSPPKRAPRGSGLIPRSFPCTVTNKRVCDIVDELKSLVPEQYRNASALLFRTMLELGSATFSERQSSGLPYRLKHKSLWMKKQRKRGVLHKDFLRIGRRR